MITASPIRTLSNEVALQMAITVQKFYELCMAADPLSGYVALPPEQQKMVVDINDAMGHVVLSQRKLIEALETFSIADVSAPAFHKFIDDLDRVVDQTHSAITDAYTPAKTIVKLWNKNLSAMEEQNSHIDSYAESFHIAVDENCSALLANLAATVMAG